MRLNKREFLKLMSAALLFPSVLQAKNLETPKPGDHVDLNQNRDLQLSGILELSEVDAIMTPKKKTIFGDGHSHEVILNEEVWAKLKAGENLAVRSGVDSDKRAHSHWVRVKLLRSQIVTSGLAKNASVC